MSAQEVSSIRVLLVEDRADRPLGHYAPRIRRLAEGFVAAGHPVTVLTSLGLSIEAAGQAASDWEVHRFGPAGRGLERLVRRVDDLPARHRWRRPLRQVSVRLRSMLILVETHRAARRLGQPDQVAVVVSGTGLSPILAAWFVPNRGRWLSYRHDRAKRSTPRPSKAGATADRLAGRVTTTRVRTRARHGGRYVLAGTFDDLVDTWRPRLPQVSMGTVRLAVAPEVGDAVDRDEARRRLGLPPSGPLALFFGTLHPGKSPDTVWAAWHATPPPAAGLVAAGAGMADSLADWVTRHSGGATPNIHVIDGAIDDPTKQLLYRACEIGVLSFTAKPTGASGTMGDLITHGSSVCCSSGGEPAALVEQYGVGAVYDVEVPSALVDAVGRVLEHPPTASAFEQLRADHAEPQVARRMLGLLFPSAT